MSDVKRLQLGLGRRYSVEGIDQYSEIEWELRTASITTPTGEVIFEQKNVEVPKTWSATATNIVASKYFHGKLGTPERESSVKQLIDRVVRKIADSGEIQGYFKGPEKQVFEDELKCILVNQIASFNSPVWFNVGCDHLEPNAKAANWHYDQDGKIRYGEVGYDRPQSSACFINSIEDSMEGIMRLAHTEAMLFKFGSGTGTNFSALRSSKEHVSGGGTASGPLSFMRGLDAFAGVIKSGGKTRRAAKMAIMNADHPDIEEFINCKLKEEEKAYALMREGYDGSSGPDSEAYASIFYQNANNSVRASDEFMKKAESGNGSGYWPLKGVVEKDRVIKVAKADDLLRKIAEATWACGDPGMQYDDTINRWHTSKNSGRINASNPCSEYMFLDDSACNLASINLMKFLRPNGKFDVDSYLHVVDYMILAQDIIVDMSGYPVELIARNSHDYRPLGLGYANLGGLLMALGLAYDSDAGRAYAAAVTSAMCGEAYRMSARMAAILSPLKPVTKLLKEKAYDQTSGACPGWFHNREPFLEVIQMHRKAAGEIPTLKEVPTELRNAAEEVWVKAYELGREAGYRNSQVTVLAPTGTIGFMMDCDTTGIEPELGLVKFKKLVGGGMMKLVNDTVGKALSKLGYKDPFATQILEYINLNGTAEGSGIAPEHLPVFDTSFKPVKGTRSIHWSGHVKMMAATQPFLSGAISKTVNMPEDSTVEDIVAAYIEAWKLGVKAIAIYRDGSKKNQVLVTKKDEPKLTDIPVEKEDVTAPPKAVRHRLPDERMALTHKFNIAGHEGYLTIGLYENGMPGEIFITMAKEGSTISGLMDAFATTTSVALQHGVPLKTLCEKLAHMRFEPSGWSKNAEIGYAKSIMDYIFRYLEMKYLSAEKPHPDPDMPAVEHLADAIEGMMEMGDSPTCQTCGAIMVRNGSCYKCMECGGTSGCS